MNSWFKYLTFVMLFYAVSGFSQKVKYKFSEQNGLPSSEVYGCVQDDRGYMWITTIEGLVRYDSRNFIEYTVADGLSTNFNWRLYKDGSGRIWMGNNITPFTYVKNDSVYRVGESYAGFYFDNLLFDQLGNTYITSYHSKVTYVIDKNDQVNAVDSILYMVSENNDLVWLTNEMDHIGLVKMAAGNNQYALLKSSGHEVYIEIKDPFGSLLKKIFLSSSHEMSPGVYNISFIGDDLYVGYPGQGIIKYSKSRDYVGSTFLKSKQEELDPLAVYLDRNQNVWAADIDRGLFCFYAIPNNIDFVSYPKEVTASRCFDWGAEEYGIRLDNGELLLCQEDTSNVISVNTNVESIISLLSGTIVVSTSTGVQFELDSMMKKPKYVEEISFGRETFDITELKNIEFEIGGVKCWSFVGDTLYLGTRGAGFSFYFDQNQLIADKYYEGYVYAINKIENEVWIGTSSELLVKDSDGELKKLHHGSVKRILEFKDQVVVRLEDGEVLFFNKKSKELIKSSSSYKRFHDVQLLGKALVFLGEEEIVLYQDDEYLPELRISEGLHAGRVLQVLELKDRYRIISEYGYYDFDNFDNWTSVQPIEEVLVESVQVSNGYQKDQVITFYDKDNFLNIELTALRFPVSKDLSFHYRLNDGKWEISTNNEISIFNIPYGEYRLEMKAVKSNGDIYGDVVSLKISNPQPFYQSLTFYVLLVVFTSVLVIVILILLQRRRIKMLQMSFETSENKQKMLVMQMKPHFLSNLFNSLQAGLLNDEVEQNSLLLSKADRYLRKTLKSSEKSIVSLEEEISFVSDYVDLERTRFSIPIEFEIDDSTVEHGAKILLPVFILQPLIENALWHGIHRSQELDKGGIKISVIEEANYYQISVYDNGIGIGNSAHIGNSISIKNIEERLSLIDKKSREKYVNFEKLTPGTKVSIYVTKHIKDYSY